MEGWVDLGDQLHAEMVYLPTDGQSVTHLCTNPAMHCRDLNSRHVDHKTDALTTTSHPTKNKGWLSPGFTTQPLTLKRGTPQTTNFSQMGNTHPYSRVQTRMNLPDILKTNRIKMILSPVKYCPQKS